MMLTLAALPVAAVAVFWIGAATSLDRSGEYAASVAALPLFSELATTNRAAAPLLQTGQTGQTGGQTQLVRIPANSFEFRARVSGFNGSAGNLILLHGFPETSAMWTPLIDAAAAAGYRVVAFDQRGYSPAARPPAIAAYTVDHLMRDISAVADAVGFETFHLVGHDWGAAVGWSYVLTHPQRVNSWTALSIPHVLAFGEAMATDPDQAARSNYMTLFRMPWVPEQLFAFNRLKLLRESLYAGHAEATRNEYLQVFAEPGALSAALNWYRAMEDFAPEIANPEVQPPVLFIWGNRDPAVARAGVVAQQQFMPPRYREVELDAEHWLMSSHGDLITEAVLTHIQAP